ncbi:D-glycero-alpha-D-manno-heptose 1-phosphate guanylyltransferase [bioreactor metagenome]|uniref:D-glycero-alpha-D-manno-heptose 1-phosphate guanylyltransferase n=1 Tax=bioreactor metagenome TaxID=1076179 RepID=A0A645H876_9ZZZZ
MDALIKYGMENINVTVNYLGEQLEEHYREKRNNIQVKCVREPSYLGTMGSVKFVDSFVNDTVLVMNSDLFTNIDYEDFYLHFLENGADMSVAAIPYSVNVPYGIFELRGRDIQGVKEKPTFNYYANAGIYLIRKKLFDLIPDNVFYNATDFIETLISKNHNVIRYPLTGYWIDIGKLEDYQKAQELVKHL